MSVNKLLVRIQFFPKLYENNNYETINEKCLNLHYCYIVLLDQCYYYTIAVTFN
jgi:hypothetical protein